MHIERELKFSTTEEHVPSLAELRGALAEQGAARLELSPAAIARHVDSYYDTAEGHLLAAGWALRRRQRGDATLATLKGAAEVSGALHARQEIETELDPAAARALAAGTWPPVIAAKLSEHVEAARLRVLLELHVRRVTVGVTRVGATTAGVSERGQERHGSVLAELAFDEVVCTPPGQAASGRPLRDSPHFIFHEVEIEAADGSPASAAALDELARAVASILPLTPSTTSKLERAKTLLGPFLED